MRKNGLNNRHGDFCESRIRACPESVGVGKFCRLRLRLRLREKQPTPADSDSGSDSDSAALVLAELTRLLAEGPVPARHSVSSGVKPWLRHWQRLRLLDGVLFKVYRSRPRVPESLQVVIPRGLVAGVLTSLHAGPCGGHFASEKLLKQVKSRFFCVGMSDDVNTFCKECDRCAGRNSPTPKPRASMGELYASEPWEMVSMDFLTDLPVTDRGNKHLLVVCGPFHALG